MRAGYFRNRWIVFIHDVLWIPLALFLAYSIRFSILGIPADLQIAFNVTLAMAIPVHAGFFWVFGCYRGIWRYASIPDLMRIAKAVAAGFAVMLLLAFLYNRLEAVPRSVLVLYPLILMLGLSVARITYRIWKDSRTRFITDWSGRALVIGAGRAGESLVRDLQRHGPYEVVGLVDDDAAKAGAEIHGIRILGGVDKVPTLARQFSADLLIIAIPTASRQEMDRIVEACSTTGLPTMTLPLVRDVEGTEDALNRLRPVTIADLLGRDEVDLDFEAVSNLMHGKTVLVTGAGGSIGSELCRLIRQFNPRFLVMLDHSEFNLFELEQEFTENGAGAGKELVFQIGDVSSRNSMWRIFNRFRPEVVIHSAAYKHVPMVERNILEGLRNNVFGTQVVADLSAEFDVEEFVLVSTDKTVNPTNVMGVSKRIAEFYCQAVNRRVATRYITVRFGNVLASRGSVVPMFEEQIRAGGPVTVTHPDITRYFMTLREAASLILQAGATGNGGEIFVLDMGKAVQIQELAENMIRLSGLEPGRDIEIRYVGLRPGEKLHEELFYPTEEIIGTGHPKLLLATSFPPDWEWLQGEIFALGQAVRAGDELAALVCMQRLVPEFCRQGVAVNVGDQGDLPRLRAVK